MFGGVGGYFGGFFCFVLGFFSENVSTQRWVILRSRNYLKFTSYIKLKIQIKKSKSYKGIKIYINLNFKNSLGRNVLKKLLIKHFMMN